MGQRAETGDRRRETGDGRRETGNEERWQGDKVACLQAGKAWSTEHGA
ncbi:MAG: hypothetical protein ABFD10_06080 [Prolixibacteraceae bacterium]